VIKRPRVPDLRHRAAASIDDVDRRQPSRGARIVIGIRVTNRTPVQSPGARADSAAGLHRARRPRRIRVENGLTAAVRLQKRVAITRLHGIDPGPRRPKPRRTSLRDRDRSGGGLTAVGRAEAATGAGEEGTNAGSELLGFLLETAEKDATVRPTVGQRSRR
jgi:hypothetical protein